MHVIQVVALNLDGDYADASATEALAGVLPGDENTWFDWYEVGGRWDSLFAQKDEDGTPGEPGLVSGNVLPILGHETAALHWLQDCVNRQDRAFRETRDNLTGATVAVADLSGHVFGLPVAQDQAHADRLTTLNQEVHAEWVKILKATTIQEATGGSPILMSLYHAQRMVRLLQDEWGPDSAYIDYHDNLTGTTSNPQTLINQIHEKGNLEGVALVAVDFHY